MEEIKSLPFGHLQLSGKVRRFARQFKTIGGLLEAVESSRDFIPKTSTLARRQFDWALEDLYRVTQPGGLVDWDLFREQREIDPASTSLYFYSPVLRQLDIKTKRARLATLHLKQRAITELNGVGIKTIGDLVTRAASGIETFCVRHSKTSRDIVAALSALSGAVRPTSVDWISFAEESGFLILPEQKKRFWAPSEFIAKLPEVAAKAVESRYGARAVTILQNRLLGPQDRGSLQAIGTTFNRTRERIRVVEEQITTLFGGIFLADEYQNCAFRLRPEFIEPLSSLEKKIGKLRSLAFSLKRWEDALTEHWHVHSKDIAPVERLILSVLNQSLLRTSRARPGIPTSHEVSLHQRKLNAEIERLLTRHHPGGLTTESLRRNLQRRLKFQIPAYRELESIGRSNPLLEFRKGRLRARTSSLLRTTDQAERILRAAGKPIGSRNLAGKILGQKRYTDPRAAKTLSQSLSADPRFVAVGRSKFWALAEWKFVDARSVPDIAADILGSAKTPLHFKDLFALIAPRRPAVKKDSIRKMLSVDPRFTSAGRGFWKLAVHK